MSTVSRYQSEAAFHPAGDGMALHFEGRIDMYENVPEELKVNGSFCLWKYEQRKGRTTKVPYQVNGMRARSSDKSTFAGFGRVMETRKGYDGIGIGVFDGYSGIDIDHCVEDGKLSPMAQDIVRTMDSYAELSPSGTGVHIHLRADGLSYDKARYYINNRKLGLEIYVHGYTNKYLTMTGNVIHDAGVNERSTELMKVLDTYMVRKQESVNPSSTPALSYLSDESVLHKAQTARNREKFKQLWEGCFADDTSHSEADAALCSMLAFWCGGDMDQMDRLFRASGLMREKWERDDYRTNTLRNAVSMTREFYKPAITGPASEDFNDVLGILVRFDVLNNPRYRNSDIGSGRLFADVYKDIARYVPERRKWYIYDGKRWVADIGSLKAMELCKDLADSMLLYALSIKEENARTGFLKNCQKWQQRRVRETYLKEAQSVFPIPMHLFDQNKYLLNCNNGTLDLGTREFREHRPDDYLSKMTGIDYDPTAVSQRFITFVDEIMSSDKERARFLQKSFGYGISGDTRHECLFILYGLLTRNGKGTVTESVLVSLGDYGASVRPETIAQKNQVNSQGPSEDIARLAGIRFANISEPARGLVINAAQVKSMTGNDTINARFLNENSFDYKPQFKLYINTNYLPVVTDMTLFSSGRIIIIPFDRHFEEWEQDKTLKQEFNKPEVQSAILNWLVEGYWMLEDEGLEMPKSVREATQTYFHESNKVEQFIEDRLVSQIGGEARTSNIYESYRDWCASNGCYAENIRSFNNELRKYGNLIRRRPLDGGEKTTLLLGYCLKPDMDFLD
ncbi:phage/plasmid primase, P4 family [uncultured Sphaerochaeta sp.]|uniref:phage/plasmid primase, P4 family n=1 Tax=uncultured Sphaerochaeta sp. TaxID=886478 RepID=UPI002A0A9BB9|nr:phage/plasmid primase, P4 family [uncultured Sphaerochaeta sp.]